MVNEETDEIVVVGTRQTEVPAKFAEPLQVDEGGGVGSGSGGGAGWGSNNPPEIIVTAKRECATAAAEEISGHIEAQIDGDNKFEFVAVIVRGADQLHGAYLGELHTDYNTSYAKANLPPDRSSITGVIHNHVWQGSTSDRAENRYPSPDDWQNLQSLVWPPQGQGANPDELSMYILDAFGTLREFKYSDRGLYEALSGQDRINGVDLPDETNGCEG